MSGTQHVGGIIRKKRESLRWSLEYAAEMCDMCPRALDNIELGKSEPLFKTVVKIKNAMDIDWKDFEQCCELYR